MNRRTTLILLAWGVLIAAGALVDRSVAQGVHDRGWDDKPAWAKSTHRVPEALKFPGTFFYTAIAAVLLGLTHKERWRAAALVAGAGAISGLNGVVKWAVGRHRPVVGIEPFDFHAFVGGLPGLLGAERNLSFPSGHASMAFATAAAIGFCLPRYWSVFWLVAAVVAVERVAENAHYVSDSVCGAGFGILSAIAMRAILNRVWKRSAVVPN